MAARYQVASGTWRNVYIFSDSCQRKRRSNSIDRKLRKLWPTLKTNAALVPQKCQTLPSIIMTLVVNAFPSENIIGGVDPHFIQYMETECHFGLPSCHVDR
ncbi:hypothetical protein P5673_009249 [Acropora cervicornis]|uniref:Uncharacterized protein n=1 Tax=Acropora cervicornis TaxID=6130 RepID=A0AAD9QSC6_ACRCE|nr:hypothetical protein P5673_009249 [Acropora cervicornis]